MLGLRCRFSTLDLMPRFKVPNLGPAVPILGTPGLAAVTEWTHQ